MSRREVVAAKDTALVHRKGRKPHIVEERRGPFVDTACLARLRDAYKVRVEVLSAGDNLPPGVCVGCRKAGLRSGRLAEAMG